MKRLALLLSTLFAILSPVAASAVDVPLLTWERGHVQQVVLGVGQYQTFYKVYLKGAGIKPIEFVASAKNAAGYYVYSVDLPKDLPLGSYEVVTSSAGTPDNVVAGVAIVEVQTHTATSSRFDLTILISIFALFGAVFTALRARKYINFPFEDTQDIFNESNLDTSGNFFVALGKAPELLRKRSLGSLKPSLFAFLFVRDGELLHRISKPIYNYLPLAALFVGAVSGIEVKNSNGIAQTGLAIFIVNFIVAAIDPFSGIFATLGFWAVELTTGHLSSVRDILVMVATAIMWIGTPLITSTLRHGLNVELKSLKKPSQLLIDFGAPIIAALFGALNFYFANFLINSVIYTAAPKRTLNIVELVVVLLVLVAKQLGELFIFRKSYVPKENFYIARINSPAAAVVISLIIFSFVYTWTQAALTAVISAALFSLPFYLSFMAFKVPATLQKLAFNRSIAFEPLIIAALTFIVLKQVSTRPLLNDQMAQLMLMAAAIPSALHAFYSIICSSREAKEIITL